MLKKKYTWCKISNSYVSLCLSSAVFLASPEASYISGEILAVTGGLSTRFTSALTIGSQLCPWSSIVGL